MSNLYASPVSAVLTVPEAVNEDGVTFYHIRMEVGEVNWTTKHRYRDFSKLHESLMSAGLSTRKESGLDKDSLPQKKLLGNKDPAFIMKRRRELEAYIQSVFKFYLSSAEAAVEAPDALVQFLHLDRYDVNFVLKKMAADAHDRADAAGDKDEDKESSVDAAEDVTEALEATDLLDAASSSPPSAGASSPQSPNASSNTSSSSDEEWTPLEMHSLSERLRSALPPPPENPDDPRRNFANVAERANQLGALRIRGSRGRKLGSSNVVPDELQYDFMAFRNLTNLTLDGAALAPGLISSMGSVRATLRVLRARRCGLRSCAQALMLDEQDRSPESVAEDDDVRARLAWPRLERLDLKGNSVAEVDAAVGMLAARLRCLVLADNDVAEIKNLTKLSELSVLDLSGNQIEETQGLNTKLGQLSRLDLARNRIQTLEGFSKLYSLQSLDVSANRLGDFDSVSPVSQLPILENLNLQGNKITTAVDYRIKVFEQFGKRCSELCLDNELPSQAEVDKVSVRMALRVAREGMSPTSLFGGNLPRRVTN